MEAASAAEEEEEEEGEEQQPLDKRTRYQHNKDRRAPSPCRGNRCSPRPTMISMIC